MQIVLFVFTTRPPYHPPTHPHRREELPSRDKIYMTLGIDPGRKDLLTVKDMHNNHVRYTAKQHYAEAGIYKFTRKVAALQASAPDFVKRAYKCPTRKTASGETLLRRVTYMAPTLWDVLAWHMSQPFRQLSFNAHARQQQALVNLAKQFRPPPGMVTIVGVGDWSADDRGGIMRGRPPGPWFEFVKYLREFCTVVVIHEFRTSKLCALCHRPLQPHKYPPPGGTGTQVPKTSYATKRCSNRDCPVTTVNRDENAASNILTLTCLWIDGDPRPFALGGPPPSPLPVRALLSPQTTSHPHLGGMHRTHTSIQCVIKWIGSPCCSLAV
uniref:Uncharacterized protein n=1 Tax=Auxenochlorella protothecoides TaxID=3075 RepID=A0A1D2AHV3_AUXPR